MKNIVDGHFSKKYCQINICEHGTVLRKSVKKLERRVNCSIVVKINYVARLVSYSYG